MTKKQQKLRGVLQNITEDGASESIKLRRDSTIFGRDKGDIVLNDRECSSTHCQIQNIDGEYHIFDMNSTNGTFINSERIIKAKLKPEDVIKIGASTFKFVLEEESKVRHISTIFKKPGDGTNSKSSLVDTLIETELRSQRESVIHITIQYHDGKNDEFDLRQKIIFIGRASSFGKFDQDPEISRRHVKIKLNDTGEIFFEDQGSTNGTFLNGKKIKGMHLLKPNDTLQAGLTKFKIKAKSA